MKPFNRRTIYTLLFAWSFTLHAANLPADWRYDQSFTLSATGLTKLSLPLETLDAARPALEDLRLFDAAGNEVPYVIERPVPTVKIVRAVKLFQVAMQARSTVLTIETGLTQPLDTVTLETPALDFLKPVRVAASADGRTWQPLAQGQPVFRQPNGASRLQLTFSSGLWAWLRLTVDDERSKPIPFTGARVHATVTESAPVEWTSATLSEGHENPGETRLALNLGAANLSIASVQLETAEPLFARQVTLAVPQVLEDSIREQPVGQGTVFRVAVEGQTNSENLSVPLEQLVRSRELLVFIKNDNNPPLPITAVRIERRPVYLVFLAKQAGTFHLLAGNERCPAPKYDLAALGMNLKTVAVAAVNFSPADNPSFHATDALAGIAESGTALDVAAWKFRKPVAPLVTGAQRLQLDLDVLSAAQPGFADLRILREGSQIPYILEHPSFSQLYNVLVTATNDAKNPQLSRWRIQLPGPDLPVARLVCSSPTPLFERDLTLYENASDARGEIFRHVVGQATWVQRPGQTNREFVIALTSPPQTGTLILETSNGDNPPVELENFRAFLPVTRVLFKARANENLALYYGNPHATAPRYDLGLVADQLLAAKLNPVAAGKPEQLRKNSWGENQMPGQGGVVFWGILAVVVVVLLVVIARLLPKASPPPSY